MFPKTEVIEFAIGDRRNKTVNNSVESKGLKILKIWLKANGRKFADSDDRTFDLIVDGKYAELKAKSRGWDSFDFIALTSNQKRSLGKKLKLIFVVLNINDSNNAEVIEIKAEDLIKCKHNQIVHYEWNKGVIAHLRKKKRSS